MAAMTTASRTTGVAPLAVFFDAVDEVAGTEYHQTFDWTSGVEQPADLEGSLFTWHFGDAGAGNWTQTGKSRNVATGYTAAHVFETPGVYVVTLWVTNNITGIRTQYEQTITVTAPDSLPARYVAANGSDSNPGTQAAPYATLYRGMQDVQSGAAKRLYLRRGDTFNNRNPANSAATWWLITQAGPGLIGAWADGTTGHAASDARPLINVYEVNDTTNVFAPADTGTDWRFLDLQFTPPSNTTEMGSIGPTNALSCAQMLQMRIRTLNNGATAWPTGIGWGDWWPRPAPTPYQGRDQMFLWECESMTPGGYGYYVGARRLAVMGCYADGGRGTAVVASHAIRVWQAHKGVVTNCNSGEAGGHGHALKLHGPLDPVTGVADIRAETRWVSVTDNVFRDGGYNPGGEGTWTVSIGPQSNASAEAENISHVLFERNRFAGSSGSQYTQAKIEASCLHAFYRNNVLDLTPNAGGTGILYFWRNTSVAQPNDVRIYNNTFYNGDSASCDAITVDANCLNFRVRNNLFGCATTVGQAMLAGAGGTGWAASNNLLTSSPAFTAAAAGDFSIQATSPAIDAGATLLDVLEDYARSERLVPYDLGALQYGSSGTPPGPTPTPTVQTVSAMGAGYVRAIYSVSGYGSGWVGIRLAVAAPSDLAAVAFPVTASGEASPQATVLVYNDDTGELIGTTVADAAGAWTITLPIA